MITDALRELLVRATLEPERRASLGADARSAALRADERALLANPAALRVALCGPAPGWPVGPDLTAPAAPQPMPAVAFALRVVPMMVADELGKQQLAHSASFSSWDAPEPDPTPPLPAPPAVSWHHTLTPAAHSTAERVRGSSPTLRLNTLLELMSVLTGHPSSPHPQRREQAPAPTGASLPNAANSPGACLTTANSLESE